MDKRHQQLSNNRLEQLNKEVTMVLQSLQWDREQLLKGVDYVSCSYESNHKMPVSALEEHEKICFLKTNGYSKDEMLLPDPVNTMSTVKLSNEDIQMIMNTASSSKPHSSIGGSGPQPLSLARLQQALPAAARRALHDAVLAAAPARARLALAASNSNVGGVVGGSGSGGGAPSEAASRAQRQAAARDTRRRRARYRGGPSANYCDTLRDVIQSQMEVFTEAQEDRAKCGANQSKHRAKDYEYHRRKSGNDRKIEKRVSRKSPR